MIYENAAQKKAYAEEKSCSMCKTILQTVTNEVKKMPIDELLEIFKNLCKIIPETESQVR